MYCSLSNYFGPNKFGDHFVLECVLGTQDMHWMLVALIRKVVPPYTFWREARMIKNYYLLHHINAIPVTSISFMYTYLVLNLLLVNYFLA